MANQTVPTQLISEYFIRPVSEPEESKRPYHLSPVQVGFMGLQYMQRGLLFAKPLGSLFEIASFLDKLKHSLSMALFYFYPLAGRFVTVTYPEERASSVYLDCSKGPGVRFIHAVCSDVTVDDVVKYEEGVPLVVRSFFELGEEGVINLHGCSRPLLSVQVTELIDGLFIGFTMNHSVADGASLWHFAKTLSEIFESINNNNVNDDFKVRITHLPICRSFSSGEYKPIMKLPYSDISQFVSQFPRGSDQNLRERIFHLSSSSVAKLKAQANAESGCINNQISSFQSVCAFLWGSIIRARNLRPEDMTIITLVVNVRARTDPPLSTHHFGTMILPVSQQCKVGELLNNNLGFVAMYLKQLIGTLDDKEVIEKYKKKIHDDLLGHTPVEPSWVGGTSAVVIGGSSKFDNYGPEFGLGKPIAVRGGYAAKADGKVTISQGREGGGSMDLEVSLLQKTMDALEKDNQFMKYIT